MTSVISRTGTLQHTQGATRGALLFVPADYILGDFVPPPPQDLEADSMLSFFPVYTHREMVPADRVAVFLDFQTIHTDTPYQPKTKQTWDQQTKILLTVAPQSHPPNTRRLHRTQKCFMICSTDL